MYYQNINHQSAGIVVTRWFFSCSYNYAGFCFLKVCHSTKLYIASCYFDVIQICLSPGGIENCM